VSSSASSSASGQVDRAHAGEHGAQHRRQTHDRALGGLAVLAAPFAIAFSVLNRK
jgi:hypothetical protein